MTLENQYRRLSRLFPAEWRGENEEELIGTLLEAAEPGRESVSLAETVDLVRAAIVLRFRASFTAGRGVVGIREAALLAGLVAVGLVSAGVAAVVIRSWTSDISAEFMLTSLVVAAVPGTGVAYTISSSVGGGWRRGLFAALGCTFGIVPHILAAMLGLSGVMQAGAVTFEAVRWVGDTRGICSQAVLLQLGRVASGASCDHKLRNPGLGVEAAVAIPRNPQVDIADLSGHALGVVAVTGAAGPAASRLSARPWLAPS